MLDTSTTTEADAGRFAARIEGDPWQPDAGELAAMASIDRAQDAAQRARDDAARARGQYVPSALMRIAVSVCGAFLAERRHRGLAVAAHREGVLTIAAPRDPEVRAAVADALARKYGADNVSATAAPHIWVRIDGTTYADPW